VCESERAHGLPELLGINKESFQVCHPRSAVLRSYSVVVPQSVIVGKQVYECLKDSDVYVMPCVSGDDKKWINSPQIQKIRSFIIGSYLHFFLVHAKINRYDNDRYRFLFSFCN
jgi:hypothetical protein